MKLRYLGMLIILTFLGIAFIQVDAQAGNYYSTTDPGTTKPPGAPWVAGSPPSMPPNAGDRIWFAKTNLYIESNMKEFTVVINDASAGKWAINGQHGYYDSSHGGHTESPVAAIVKNETSGNTQTIVVLFVPQPDWEVIELIRTSKDQGGFNLNVNVDQSSHCSTKTFDEDPDPEPGNWRLTITEGWFNAPGEVMEISQVFIYPSGSFVDTNVLPFFEPLGGPVWTPEFIYDGPHAVGVRWIAPLGHFLEATQPYTMYVTTVSMPHVFYDYYAVDTSAPRVMYYSLFGRSHEIPFLVADTADFSESHGGVINFTLAGGQDYANRTYILVGSVSGTVPGTPLPGGMATLPLNWDLFTDLVLAFINTPVFSNFWGVMDGSGNSTAQMLFGPLPPGSAGLVMDFAYTFMKPYDATSNSYSVEIVP